MANPTFGSFSLQDSNYITSKVRYRHIAGRDIDSANIAKEPGSKLIDLEEGSKEIVLEGWIKGSDADDFQTRKENIHKNLAKKEQAFTVESDRQYTASLVSLDIPDEHHFISAAPFVATFLSSDPFAKASQVATTGITASGTAILTETISISGTAFAVPIVTIQPTGFDAGDSGITHIFVKNNTEGQTLTISGTFPYASDIAINYGASNVTVSGVARDFTGNFARFEPGDVDFEITTSGVNSQYTWRLDYQPRFF